MIHLPSALLLAAAAVLIALGFLGLMPLPLAAVLAAPLIAIYSYVLYARLKYRPGPPRPIMPVGEKAVVVERLAPIGLVKVQGTYWRALCDGCVAEVGEVVEVAGVRDGTLVVRK
nr:MAG: hypothetical protein TU35_02705 [Thermoproteus sp. AZ2]